MEATPRPVKRRRPGWRTVVVAAGAALAAVLSAGCATGAVSQRAGYAHVRVEGAPERGLARDMLALSTLAMYGVEPMPRAHLERRAARDVGPMFRLLQAQGHYAAEIEPSVQPGRRRPVVVFRVAPGEVYALSRVISVTEPLPELPAGLTEGRPASFRQIESAVRTMENRLRARGHPHATVRVGRIEVDHDRQQADVFLRVERGPVAVFGPVQYEGLRRLRESWLRDAVPWTEGATYNADRVEAYRDAMLQSGLFTRFDPEPPDEIGPDGIAPITVTLRERRPRTVSVSARYRTDDGAGLSVYWMHRNLAGGAERLRVQGDFGEKDRAASIAFRRPRFLRADQELVADVRATQEETAAYASSGVRAAVGVERSWPQRWISSVGVAGRSSRVEQADEAVDVQLVSLPLGLSWHDLDDVGDPARGASVALNVEPFVNLAADGVWFLRSHAEATAHRRIVRRPDLRAGIRLAAGIIAGADRPDVPADERFYAGGGGSVRGYAYQSLAPREDDIVTGGRSLLEGSVELRWRATAPLGFVAFLDGGTAMDPAIPDLSEPFRWGTGIGVRYFTAAGPIRLDIAVPLQRRRGIDDAWQLYLSVGHAF